MTQLIPGFATAEGTQSFAQAAIDKGLVTESHYRDASIDSLTFSSIGLGTYLGNPDEETNQQVTEAIISAVNSGAINVVDTAINYRYQLAERSVGKALKELLAEGEVQRSELFVASKIGYLTPDGDVEKDFITYFREEFIEAGVLTQEEVVGGVHCMTPNYLNNQLERSRQNLGLETIDLMYLHNAAESELPQLGPGHFMDNLLHAFEFFEAAREEDRIRYYGMASWNCFTTNQGKSPIYLSLEDVVEIAKEVGGDNHGFRFIQLPFNMAMTEALNVESQVVNGKKMSTLHAAQALGLGVFTSVPLMQGQLFEYDLPHFPDLESKAQACIQFVRSTPGIIAPLVGMKSSEHVADNIVTASVPPMAFDAFQANFSKA